MVCSTWNGNLNLIRHLSKNPFSRLPHLLLSVFPRKFKLRERERERGGGGGKACQAKRVDNRSDVHPLIWPGYSYIVIKGLDVCLLVWQND